MFGRKTVEVSLDDDVKAFIAKEVQRAHANTVPDLTLLDGLSIVAAAVVGKAVRWLQS